MRCTGGAVFAAVAAVAAGALLAACGVDEQAVSQPASTAHMSSQVNVSLVEFSVTATPDTVRAGKVLFKAHNDGEEPRHEFIVVRTDLAISQLPTNPDGSFDEEGAGVIVIAEIEAVRRHATRTLMLDLEAGHYVLLCNIVEIEDGEVESHFAEGMHTDFNVL
jgi:uncharacterized cupredoxin-like copper-binding protein